MLFLKEHPIRNVREVVYRENQCLDVSSIEKITKAIMPHHLGNWKIKEILEDFDRNKSLKNLVTPIFWVDHTRNPLGYLLSLCDIICQAGREAPEIAKDLPSDLEIKFCKLYYEERRNKLMVGLKYHNIDKSLMKILEDFFNVPMNFLKLNAKHGNEHDTLQISLRKEKVKRSPSNSYSLA